MIKAGSNKPYFKDYNFSISNGKIIAQSNFIKKIFAITSSPFPYVWEGDPDKVLMDRMLKELPKEIQILEYKPVETGLVH